LAVVDSVTTLDPSHADAVVVTGSHGGRIAARYASAAAVRAAIFNDAGGGLDDAGVAGLELLDSVGIAAAAVSKDTARIGDAADTLARGAVSRANALARARGVREGMQCAVAVALLREAPSSPRTAATLAAPEGRFVLRPARDHRRAIVGVDSIGLVDAADAGSILVIGSHGALHGGDPRTALAVDAHVAIFHDAGRGRDDAGTTRLPALESRLIAAGTVDYRSARIGDARSMWGGGVLSCVNAPLASFGVREGMSVQQALHVVDRGVARRD
jgi:hypothetical protein